MFQTKISSQGTISIPAVLRKKYNLQPGQTVTITDNGQITIVKNLDFETLRQRNAKYIKSEPFVHKGGDGFAAYIDDKYASK